MGGRMPKTASSLLAPPWVRLSSVQLKALQQSKAWMRNCQVVEHGVVVFMRPVKSSKKGANEFVFVFPDGRAVFGQAPVKLLLQAGQITCGLPLGQWRRLNAALHR